MNFRLLAFNNIRGNWHHYSAFFLSSVFSVMLFFIYAAFIYHPDVINGTIAAASKVQSGMIACEYIIIIFSFFFILYSMTAFLTTRKKEFGLLALYGMTSGQMRRLVFYENTLIAVLSIVTGILFGMLFSNLFFIALAQLLDVERPIRFAIAPKALYTTIVGYLTLFEVITLFTLSQVGRAEIIEMLHDSKKPRNAPLFSKWLVFLSIMSLGIGYGLAYVSSNATFGAFMLPILFFVILGTYFLFTQSSVAILRRLQKKTNIYLKRTNMITISQLVFKMKDNARILFMVSILSAVILTSSATIYVYQQTISAQLQDTNPLTFCFVEKENDAHRVINISKMKEILRNDGVKILYETSVTGASVPITLKNKKRKQINALVISETEYNHSARILSKPEVHVEKGHAVFLFPYAGATPLIAKGDQIPVLLNGKNLSLSIDKQIIGTIVNASIVSSYQFIVNDAQYNDVLAHTPPIKKQTFYGYELQDWKTTNKTVEKVEKMVPKGQEESFHSRVDTYLLMNQMTSLVMFIGIFVSVLFFVASGSMIFFKLFTELQEDQAQFKALTRIGMTEEEIRTIVTIQIGLIFFAPCVVGIVHASFAMKTLQNLLGGDILPYASVVFLIYFLMQSLYFFVTRRAYMKKILQHMI